MRLTVKLIKCILSVCFLFSCESPTNSDISLIIKGTVTNDYTNKPIENIYVDLLGRNSTGTYVIDSYSTNSEGEYRFDVRISKSSWLYVSVNAWIEVKNIVGQNKVYQYIIDPSYSTYLFNPSRYENTIQDIELKPAGYQNN